MSNTRWIISDIAKKTGIEAHVLRYWEKELSLDIPRNEMGHRYYLDTHIELFLKIHTLKESGYQLKAIKNLINNKGLVSNLNQKQLQDKQVNDKQVNDKQVNDKQSYNESKCNANDDNKNNIIEMPIQFMKQVADEEAAVSVQECSKQDKLEQFKQILGEVMMDTITKRDEEMGIQISDRIIKQMDYLLRMQEEMEDERYKRLDETIRNYQKDRQEIGFNSKKNRKKSWFGKNQRPVTG